MISSDVALDEFGDVAGGCNMNHRCSGDKVRGRLEGVPARSQSLNLPDDRYIRFVGRGVRQRDDECGTAPVRAVRGNCAAVPFTIRLQIASPSRVPSYARRGREQSEERRADETSGRSDDILKELPHPDRIGLNGR